MFKKLKHNSKNTNYPKTTLIYVIHYNSLDRNLFI